VESDLERKIAVLRRKAWTYLDAKKPDESLQCFDEALAAAPEMAALHVEKGQALTRLGRRDAALACFEEAARLDPASPDAAWERGKCLEALLRRNDAVAVYEYALTKSPGEAKLLSALGNAYAEMRRFDDALAVFGRLLEARPKDAEAWLCKGLLLWKRGDGEGGLAAVERAIQLDPKMLEAYIHRARVLRALGRDADARRACAEAIQKGPRFVDGYLLAAELVLEQGRADDALGYADKALAIDPEDPEAWRIKHRAHEKAGRALAAEVCKGLSQLYGGAAESALATMDAVIAQDAGFVHGWSRRATVLEKMGRFEEAVACFDRALEIDPRDARLHFERGMLLHEAMERRDEGLASLRRAIGLDAKRWSDLPEGLRKKVDKPRYW
jgi:tetratricopeptide (TPR) repeat protein